MAWHTKTAAEALRELNTDAGKGLSSAQARRRLEQYGKNQLEEGKKKSLPRKFFEQFSDFMVIVLLFAAGISFFTSIWSGDGDMVDPVIILLIVIVNAIIGVAQENKAERAIDALKKLSAPNAKVLRQGMRVTVPTEELVPGDILFLETGDLVPADARLITCTNLKAEESSLTGESVPVEKEDGLRLPEKAAIGYRRNMVFAMSVITSGHATAAVTQTGMDTQVGHIAHMINNEETPQTPLQVRLAKTGRILGYGALVICGIIFIMGMLEHVPVLDSFMLSVSLAVAAIPEGLPAIVTIVLSIGVQRMAKSNAIIRRLPAVETLGSATVICSDKTGTLTQNRMTVTKVCTPDGPQALSSGESTELLTFSALCNNARIEGASGKWKALGEPTENALVLASARQGHPKDELDRQYPRVMEIPFDSARKLMTTVHRMPGGGYIQVTKGAPDVLLKSCTQIRARGHQTAMTEQKRGAVIRMNDEMAADSLRVIAVACRELSSVKEASEAGLAFCGLVGMIDPPRREAKHAVSTCREAGIIPVMITGDHVITANAIAKELGILTPQTESMTGQELDRLNDTELEKRIATCRVFARVSPAHKVRIVKAFQARGEVVSMTGDGVNDAPALKAADIGCAMGKSGTDVAKGASDMILTDDNFATIVRAVSEGRGIYENIKRAIHFLLSCNIGEILVIFAASVMHLPTPLLPIQLLWVNLVTDALPAMALGVEKVDPDIMKRKPIAQKQSLFSGGLGIDIAFEGMMIGALALLSFVIGRSFFDVPGAVSVGRTMAFAVLSLSELVHAFNMRSDGSVLRIGLFSNRKMVMAFIVCALLQVLVITIAPLGAIFKTVPLTLAQWGIVGLLSVAPLVVMECAKVLSRPFRRIKKRKGGTGKKLVFPLK